MEYLLNIDSKFLLQVRSVYDYKSKCNWVMQHLDCMDISKSPFSKFYTCITAELKVIKLFYYIEHARKLPG